MKLSDLTLPEIDIKAPDFAEDPFRQYKVAKRQHWLAKTVAGHMVLGYDAMRDLLAMDDKLDTVFNVLASMTAFDKGAWGKFYSGFLLATSGEAHKRLRDLVAPAFTSRSAEQYRPVMKSVITNLVDEWEPKGRFDFVEFASYVPIAILCRLIGAPADVVPEVKDKLEVMATGFNVDPSIMSKIDVAIEYMMEFVDGLIAERMDQPRGEGQDQDLLDQLLQVTGVENGLSKQELCVLIVQSFVAGYHTSKSTLHMIVHILLDRPEDWQRLARDEAFAKSVMNEAMRYANILTLFRFVKETFTYRDVTIPKGTMLILPMAYAGRDESIYEAADSFDPLRKTAARHFGFGRGIHICLGQFIARVQLEVALPIVASRLANLSRDGEIAWRPFLGVWGLTKLPVKTGEVV